MTTSEDKIARALARQEKAMKTGGAALWSLITAEVAVELAGKNKDFADALRSMLEDRQASASNDLLLYGAIEAIRLIDEVTGRAPPS